LPSRRAELMSLVAVLPILGVLGCVGVAKWVARVREWAARGRGCSEPS
jgi:hypothetical protein